jgi:hypothetical protein
MHTKRHLITRMADSILSDIHSEGIESLPNQLSRKNPYAEPISIVSDVMDQGMARVFEGGAQLLKDLFVLQIPEYSSPKK